MFFKLGCTLKSPREFKKQQQQQLMWGYKPPFKKIGFWQSPLIGIF